VQFATWSIRAPVPSCSAWRRSSCLGALREGVEACRKTLRSLERPPIETTFDDLVLEGLFGLATLFFFNCDWLVSEAMLVNVVF